MESPSMVQAEEFVLCRQTWLRSLTRDHNSYIWAESHIALQVTPTLGVTSDPTPI